MRTSKEIKTLLNDENYKIKKKLLYENMAK